jgi:hypothetical protein
VTEGDWYFVGQIGLWVLIIAWVLDLLGVWAWFGTWL